MHIPVLLSGGLVLAPYNLSYVWPAFVVGWVFNVWIKGRHTAWWQKYALPMTTGFQVAIVLGAIIIFFAVDWQVVTLDWWGNDVSFAGVDGSGECSILPIPDVGYF